MVKWSNCAASFKVYQEAIHILVVNMHYNYTVLWWLWPAHANTYLGRVVVTMQCTKIAESGRDHLCTFPAANLGL